MITTKERLKNLRDDHDMKQEHIALIIGKTQQQYSEYETGKSEIPVRVLLKLAEFYNVSVDYLLCRTNHKKGPVGNNDEIVPGTTAESLLADILFLNIQGRDAVIEYIELLKIKEKHLALLKCEANAVSVP
jgi:transcriptional regulator with XRE-family HTH domain